MVVVGIHERSPDETAERLCSNVSLVRFVREETDESCVIAYRDFLPRESSVCRKGYSHSRVDMAT